ncbi:MAG: O-antigen ligase family protein [Roseiarcus sp.]
MSIPAREGRDTAPLNVSRLVGNAVRLICVVVLGCILSLALYQVWQLEARWSAIVVIAVTAVAISMCLVRFFSDFLLVSSLFCLPIATFVKFLWPDGYSVEENVAVAWSGLNNIGVIDFVIVGLYLSWFYRVFVVRKESLSRRFNLLDAFIMWFVVANFVATIGSVDPRLGIGATTYFLKYALLYFYLSRNLQERHLPWLLVALGSTIAIEALLGAYQFATGKLVGLAVDKGLGSSTTLNTTADLAAVPGQGNLHRASGTLIEPHALGAFLEMLLPFCAVLFLTPRLRPALRALSLIAGGAAAMTIVFTLSRGAYVGAGISMALGVVLILILWGERQVVPALAVLGLLLALTVPFTAHFLYDRLTQHVDTFDARVPVYMAALHVVADYPLFGIGPGNWIFVYPRYDQDWLVLDWFSNLIHNDVLLTAVEAGIFGVVPYVGILLCAAWRLLSLARQRRDLAGRLALAAFLGMIAYEISNQIDPMIHEPSVNLLLCIFVSLGVALPRLPPGAGAILMAPSGPRSR